MTHSGREQSGYWKARWLAALAIGLCALSAQAQPATLFQDVIDRLGRQDLSLFTMDAVAGDIDGDGGLDLVLAIEFRPNRLLLGDGAGGFAAAPHGWLPDVPHDSEDAALADFDGDGDLDLLVVSEDDQQNEYLSNDGTGRFAPFAGGLPVAGRSNGLAVGDIDGDGDIDAVIGNNGANALLVNDGSGGFSVAGTDLFPPGADVTQDVKFGDIDGDGHLDLVIANEGTNRILMGLAGGFVDETERRLRGATNGGETRDAELVDVDGDGDLDLFFANVRLFSDSDPQNRLWINDGRGFFHDETELRLPMDQTSTMDAAFRDLDGDGDVDLVTANFGDISGRTFLTPFRAYRNDGAGRFHDNTAEFLPPSARGNGMHVEIVDLDGDGQPELFLASRGGPDLMLSRTAR